LVAIRYALRRVLIACPMVHRLLIDVDAEPIGTQANDGDFQARMAKISILHSFSF
jgi:hypothetical protein